MSRLIIGAVGVALAALFWVSAGHAATVMDDDSGVAKFRVKGTTKLISPAEASRLAPDHDIEQGKPIKGAATEDGKAATVYKWSEVNYNCKVKTGNCSWKRK